MKPKTVTREGRQNGTLLSKYATGLMGHSVILTPGGERQVSELQADDRIITRNSGSVRLTSVTKRHVTGHTVQIKAGSFGHTHYDRDAIIPEHHPVLIRDWRAKTMFGSDQAIVPAFRLIDGEFVTRLEETDMLLYVLAFDQPQIIYVDGVELGSHKVELALTKVT